MFTKLEHFRQKIPVLLLSFFFLITCVYFLTRFYNLKSLPIFVDEAIYIQWAQLGRYDADQRLISLVDGKQPLFIWVTSFLMYWINNPLVAGRVASIMAGFCTSIGLLLLSYELFKNKWIAGCSMVLYILLPFSLLIDRLALYDSLVGMLTIWSMYLSILLIRHIRLDIAFLLAFSLGAGILNKSTGFMSIYILPLTIIFFDTKKKHPYTRFIKWIMFAMVAVATSYLYYSILQLSSHFSHINEKNNIFIYGFSELLGQNIFTIATHNLILFSQWIFLLFTPSFLIVVAIGLFLYKGSVKAKIFLFTTFSIEICGLAFFGKNPYPRYIFFMTLPLLPLVSLGLWYLYERYKKNVFIYSTIVILTISFAIFSDYTIVNNLEKAPVPDITKFELVNGWSAGKGIREIINYLLAASQKEQIVIITDRNYGSFSSAVADIYFFRNPRAERISIEPIPNVIPDNLLEKAKTKSVYVFFNQTQTIPHWPMKLILKYRKGTGNYYAYLYQLKKQ